MIEPALKLDSRSRGGPTRLRDAVMRSFHPGPGRSLRCPSVSFRFNVSVKRLEAAGERSSAWS